MNHDLVVDIPSPGVLRPPQCSSDHDGRFLFCKKTAFSGYIYKLWDVIIITCPGTQQDTTFQWKTASAKIRGFLVFIQLHILMYLLFLCRPQQPPQAAPPPPVIQRPRRRHNMWVRPWLLQREERGAYHNIMAELYATDIPGFTNFMRMTPEFFEMIKTRLEQHLARQATNYRAPISVGEKLALTIRYLATGESYTSLSCQFWVGRHRNSNRQTQCPT